jgi:acyl carrier protein
MDANQAAANREQAVRQIIADHLSIPLDEITDDKCLATGLGADSLDIVELSMYLEEEFVTVISDEEVGAWTTVADVIATAHRNALDEFPEENE